MKARVCILLCIGLLVAALGVGAAGRSEAVPRFGTVLHPDTSHVFTPDAPLRHPLRWSWSGVRPALTGREPLRPGPALPSLGSTRPGFPEPVANPTLYGADGNVLSMARAGNTLYIAGSFRSVGENTGGLVAIDATTGEMRKLLPKIAGAVAVVVPDGSGGWYIGGDFTAVAGKPRSCVARILSDGSVSDWSPSVTGSPGYITPPLVSAIALSGGRLFVGGAFREIGGHSHENLGCVDVRTGRVLDWNLDTNIDEPVSTFALHGDTLFVAGHFSSLGGEPRSSLAAIRATTGSVLSWRVDLYGGAGALLASGDTLYVGGDFTNIGGWGYAKLAAVRISSAYPLPIDFRFDGVWVQYGPLLQVSGLARVADTLYAVGNFTKLGGQVRSSIAALDARTGDALAWSPDTTGPRPDGYPAPLCTTVAVSGGTLYVSGYFWSVEGVYHPLAAAWDRQTGHVLDWTPTPDDIVTSLAVLGDTVYAGGYFHMMGSWQHRAGLAAIDLATGQLKPWNPNPNGVICTTVAVYGDRVFVSGDFSVIGGDPQPRNYFAALDTIYGEVLSWDPGANDLAQVILVAGDTLYVGGDFTEVGGQPRGFAAAINATTGEVLPWDPGADSFVLAMARSGSAVYLGGLFSQMAGQQRLGLASVDAYSGELSPWNPGTDNRTVKALLISGNTLYVGGGFHAIGGEARNAIAAVDVATAAVSPWYPPPTAWGVPSEVKALALQDSLLYVGGAFATMSGQPRICLAAVDTLTGFATAWDPGLDGYVWSLATSGNTLFVGGGFSRAGGLPADGLAAFSLPQHSTPIPKSLVVSQSMPNPANSNAVIRFSLPTAAAVSLAIFDVLGRRVAVPLDHALLPAGSHDVPVRTGGWTPGLYLYRVEAGGFSASRKMLVVR